MKKALLLSVLTMVMLVTFVCAEEPVVFTFNSEADIQTNVINPQNLEAVLENGYAKITTKTDDPSFYLPSPDAGLDTAVYKYAKVRLKMTEAAGETTMGQIFVLTDNVSTLGAA